MQPHLSPSPPKPASGVDARAIPWGQLLLASTVPLLCNTAILNFGPLLPSIRDEFGLSNSLAGALASATIFAHTLLQLPGGQLADHIGRKRAMALGAALMGLAVMGCALAPNAAILLLLRAVQGVGTAISYVAGLALVNGLVPPSRRSFAQAVYGASGNVGIFLILMFSERLSAFGGWRGVFTIEGTIMLGIAVLVATRLRQGGFDVAATPEPWTPILRRGPLYVLGLAHVLTYGVFTAIAAWVATFLWQAHGVGLDWAGPMATTYALSLVVGRVVGGVLSNGRERQAIFVCCFGAATMTAIVPLVPGTILALLALFLLGWFASYPFGPIFSYTSLIYQKPASARELAVVNCVANIGALVFPPMIGYGLDASGSFVVAFGAVSGVSFLGAVAVALWLPAVGKSVGQVSLSS